MVRTPSLDRLPHKYTITQRNPNPKPSHPAKHVRTRCVGACTTGRSCCVGRGAMAAALAFRASRRAFFLAGCCCSGLLGCWWDGAWVCQYTCINNK